MGKYFELCAPEFVLEEIEKYKDEIIIKAKIDLEEFDKLKREFVLYVEFFLWIIM